MKFSLDRIFAANFADFSSIRENEIPPKNPSKSYLLLSTLLNFTEIGCRLGKRNDLPYFLYNNFGNAIESQLSLSNSQDKPGTSLNIKVSIIAELVVLRFSGIFLRPGGA